MWRGTLRKREKGGSSPNAPNMYIPDSFERRLYSGGPETSETTEWLRDYDALLEDVYFGMDSGEGEVLSHPLGSTAGPTRQRKPFGTACGVSDCAHTLSCQWSFPARKSHDNNKRVPSQTRS